MSCNGLRAAWRKTGGDWLNDTTALVLGGRLELVGNSGIAGRAPRKRSAPSAKRILLTHYPTVADQLDGRKFDLILAGHTHGGQVRIPLTPLEGMGPYDRGLFQTPAGPLYVNPGIGTYYLDARFRCRPEITVIEF